MAILDLTISPKKKGEESLRGAVAIAERVIRASGLPNMLTPMSTIIEGGLRELLDLILKVNEALVAEGYYRVYTIAKIDHRVDKDVRMMDKVRAVETELAKDGGN